MDWRARCQAAGGSLAKAADRLLDLVAARGASDGLERQVTTAFGQALPDPNTNRRRAGPARRGFSGRRWRRQACWASG